jgi:uncharacterized membrane protein YfcA
MTLDWPALLLLFGAGAVASGVNAVAGGGSLISFPALIGLGIPMKPANATNAVALWPGSLASAIGFWSQLRAVRRFLPPLLLVSAIGSILGAMLLVATPPGAFRIAVPILILIATLLLAFQPRVRRWAQGPHGKVGPLVGYGLQLAVAVYGGYFGAGMGIMMLAVFGLMMDATIHELNAIKTWIAVLINVTASLTFLTQRGMVLAEPAVAVGSGAIVGGYLAARWSMKVESEKLRKAIVVYGFAMVAWFTWRLVAE